MPGQVLSLPRRQAEAGADGPAHRRQQRLLQRQALRQGSASAALVRRQLQSQRPKPKPKKELPQLFHPKVPLADAQGECSGCAVPSGLVGAMPCLSLSSRVLVGTPSERLTPE